MGAAISGGTTSQSFSLGGNFKQDEFAGSLYAAYGHGPAWGQVKAAGGVRTFEKLMEVRALGVTRVGATATKAILDDAKAKLGG